MSLLSKKNKLDTIHLDYDVQVIPIGEFETNLKESITDEITKFIKEHILRVLSDRKYASKLRLRSVRRNKQDAGSPFKESRRFSTRPSAEKKIAKEVSSQNI